MVGCEGGDGDAGEEGGDGGICLKGGGGEDGCPG